MFFDVTECNKSYVANPDYFMTWTYEQTKHYYYQNVPYKGKPKLYKIESSDIETIYINPIPGKPDVYEFSYSVGNHEAYQIFYCTDKQYIINFVKSTEYYTFLERHNCQVIVEQIMNLKEYKNHIKGFIANIKGFASNIKPSKEHFYIITIIGITSYRKREILTCRDRLHDDQYLDAGAIYNYYLNTYPYKLAIIDKLRSIRSRIVEYRLINHIADYCGLYSRPDLNKKLDEPDDPDELIEP